MLSLFHWYLFRHPFQFSNQKHAAPISLAAFKGKAIVLNFWASWCDPCKQETPLLESEWQKVQSRDIVFLGVDFQDSQANGLSFLHQYHITYPCVQDTSGSMVVPYNLVGLPTTYFINSKGLVVSSIPHQMNAQELQQQVQALLAQT